MKVGLVKSSAAIVPLSQQGDWYGSDRKLGLLFWREARMHSLKWSACACARIKRNRPRYNGEFTEPVDFQSFNVSYGSITGRSLIRFVGPSWADGLI